MNRLAIFVFYDPTGIVDEYVFYYLLELQKVVSRLIVVVNGKICERDVNRLRELSAEIVLRQNIGFDGGAHAEVLIDYVGLSDLRTYDELVLCNDTCYGPFVPFQTIWDKMDTKTCDFWGLNCIKNGLTDHMQAYFLVFRKRLLENDFLYDYFKYNLYKKSLGLREVIALYEKGLYKTLVESGYIGEPFITVNNLNMYESSDWLLKEYGFPMLKKKCFSEKYNPQSFGIKGSVEWVTNCTQYPMDIIWNNVYRVYENTTKFENINMYNSVKHYGSEFAIRKSQLIEFMDKHTDIWIYGCGMYAKEIFHLYVKNSGKFRGFIVSDYITSEEKELYGYPIKSFSQVDTQEPLIVALSKQNTEMVRNSLLKREALFLFQ